MKTTVKQNLSKFLLMLFLLPTLAFAGWCAYTVHTQTSQSKLIKKDYAEVNNLHRGLLSADVWRDSVTSIINEQIQDFELSKEQSDTLVAEVNHLLNALVTEVDEMANEKQKGLKKNLKKLAFKTFVNTDNVRERIPELSERIINTVKKPSSKRRLKFLLSDKLEEMSKKTSDIRHSASELDSLFVTYNVPDSATFNLNAKTSIVKMQTESYFYSLLLLGVMTLFLSVWFFIRKQAQLYKPMFTMSVVLALIVLAIGLTAPMIEIDARINEINFFLIGKHIVFLDQVIIFQSKSIIDVVRTLIDTHKPGSVAVGFLLLIFSVFFPIAKLLATRVYLMSNPKWQNNKLINFFAFKSGKWSMADVLVLAIFMAFVGFNGILDQQMESISRDTTGLSSIATNQTSLQPGFILFLSFVLYGLILSVILTRITKKNEERVLGQEK